ncbi:MAG: hypothetical protein EOM67_11520 [Spirochaetia bacterium]|nr:hypothetical protein [Spirochaetia bacterium]
MTAKLEHPSGIIKECPVGFSWTTLFFSFFVPIFRGDWKWLAIMVIADFFTAGVAWLAFPFFYNKKYIEDLVEKGYLPSTHRDADILSSVGIHPK